MKVLIACEYSGRVREAFRKRGHDAWPCDLLPSEDNSPHHFTGDLFYALSHCVWDLVIAHPPCTDLCSSGSRWWGQKRKDGSQQRSIEFFMSIVNHHHMPKKWAIENPIGLMSTIYRKPDQIIQPWEYGHDASKSTCLWLNGLPKLVPTALVAPRIINGRPRWGNQTDSGQNKLPPSEDRWKERSRTYQGIADAMAEQWG
jgi:hypothetical protein